MVAIRTFKSDAAAHLPAPALRSPNAPLGVASSPAESGLAVTFDFEKSASDSSDHSVTPAQQQAFRADLERQLVAVRNWFAQWQWLPDGPSDLHVVVSHRFRISKSLVPAWFGQRGRMEFPVRRVAGGTAAVAHELTHVYFPNANRFIAEGLAVYVQAEIGVNPAFPNFGERLHELAGRVLDDIQREYFCNDPRNLESCALLPDLDAIATPSPLTLKVGANFYGEGPRGQRVVYPIAGSFVSFLIETRGIGKFRELYQQTPFRPQTCTPGASDRWRNVYGLSLTGLEVEWKSTIATCDRVALDPSTRESHGA